MYMNPIWFNEDYYLSNKLSNLRATDSRQWTMSMLINELEDAGYDNPYDHYVDYGDDEGIGVNPLFDENTYVLNKSLQCGLTPQATYDAIRNAGMTTAEHYDLYGFKEGINPSNNFDQDKYLQAKLYQMQSTDPSVGIMDLVRALDASNLTPVEHYLLYAEQEGLTESDANALGYSYVVADNRPVANPNKDKGFEYSIDYSSNTIRDVIIENVIKEIEQDGSITYCIEKTTVDTTTINEVTNITIVGSTPMDLSDVLDMIGA